MSSRPFLILTCCEFHCTGIAVTGDMPPTHSTTYGTRSGRWSDRSELMPTGTLPSFRR
jgi:hypothetical protein